MGVALSALLLRALVPAGFMAAPLAQGWLFQLCPSGMAAASFTALLGTSDSANKHAVHLADGAAHVHHQGSGGHGLASHTDHLDHTGSEADPLCGLSVGFAAIDPTDSAVVEPERLAQRERPLAVLTQRPRAPPRANPVRGPPVFS